MGRRVSKSINGTTTQYLYDGLNPVQELNGNGGVVANMLTGLNVDEYFQRTEPACCGPLSYLTDALGSTLALADGNGVIQDEYQYEPFGHTGYSYNNTSTNSYEFTGRENDSAGFFYDIYFYRGRYYSPAFQRFISQDPLDFGGGDANLYAYVQNDAPNERDPLGFTDVIIGIQRATADKSSIIGRLSVGEQPIGVTLEAPYRDNREYSSIPEGTYPATTYQSPRSGEEVILLQDVPKRSWIEIHPGNFPRDTVGCVLPGRSAGKDRIYRSREPFNQLMSIIHVTRSFDAAIGEPTDISVDVGSAGTQ